MSTSSYLARRAIYQSQHQDEVNEGKTMQSPGFQPLSGAGVESLQRVKAGEALRSDVGGARHDAETMSPV